MVSDIILAGLGMAATLYAVFNYEDLILRAGRQTQMDIVLGVIGIILVLEAARRVVGTPIVLVASVFFILFCRPLLARIFKPQDIPLLGQLPICGIQPKV